MEISKAAAGFLAAACLTVGAGGAYLLKQSSDPRPEVPPTNAVDSAAPAAGVEQSEAIISEPSPSAAAPELAPAVSAAAPAPSAPPAAERRSRPEPRRVEPRRQRTVEEHRSSPADTAPSRDASYIPTETRTATAAPVEPVRTIETAPVLPPPAPVPQFEDLVIASDSVIGLQVETSVTSERARVEDAVVARVTRDVKVGDRVAIPSGAKAQGEVTLVERGGKLRERARLGVRFTSIVLADGTRVPIDTETIIREGDSPGGESAAKIGGGAIGGAIIGGILGGAKGAVIGGSAGAGAGTAAVMAGGRNPATLPSGTPVTVRIQKPATVTVEK
jgi:hypothetical protein